MADEVKSIYVDEMIDKWTYWNICPIVDGKIDFREDCYLDDRLWGEESGEFLHKHFGSFGIINSNKKLNEDDEVLFIHYAHQNEKVYEALRDYLAMLHITQSEFSKLMHWMGYNMLLGKSPFSEKKGASVKGANAKYYWRDILIAVTVDIWRDLHPKLPVKNDNYDEDQVTICSIIHAAFQKLTPEDKDTLKPDRIYRVYLKERKN